MNPMMIFPCIIAGVMLGMGLMGGIIWRQESKAQLGKTAKWVGKKDEHWESDGYGGGEWVANETFYCSGCGWELKGRFKRVCPFCRAKIIGIERDGGNK